MENCRINILISISIIVLCTLLSCEDPQIIDKPSSLTAKEQLLAIDWQYETLLVAGDTFNIPSQWFEPYQWADTRSVQFRWFRYDADGTYELRWDTSASDMQIGTVLNYQPNFGFWRLSENNEDSLIHNLGFGYETGYIIIELTEDQFIREYLRIVQNSNLPDVEIGDTVVYREVFVPRIK